MEVRICVLERDDAERKRLTDELGADGYSVHATDSVEEAFCACTAEMPDLLVVGECGGTGAIVRLIRAVRDGSADTGRIPTGLAICVIGNQGADELELVRALDAGADDYVPGDSGPAELRARIAALLRRTGRWVGQPVIRVGSLEVRSAERKVSIGGRPVELCNKELALLVALAMEPTRVFTKRELLRSVWGYPDGLRTRTLDSHASRLRRKLAEAGGEGFVVTAGRRLPARRPGARLSPDERVEYVDREHGRALRAHARRLARTPEDAEDAYNAALLDVWRWGPDDGEDHLVRWAFTAVRNEVAKLYRRKRPRAADPLLEAWSEDPTQDVERIVVARDWIERRGGIEADRFRVLYARAIGVGSDEDGSALGLSRRQARKRVEKGRRDLEPARG